MMMPRHLIAIDPGKSGAIAVGDYNCVTNHLVATPTLWKLPYEPDALHHALVDICCRGSRQNTIAVEDVGYHVKGNNAQASATFARSVGRLEAVLWEVQYQYCNVITNTVHWVRPAVWQSAILPPPLPVKKSLRKQYICDFACARITALTGAPIGRAPKYAGDALGMLVYMIQEELWKQVPM